MSRLPPLNALRAFEAAARHMSFKSAADELNVTPSALSYQIRQLEDNLGVPLFIRMNRAVKLTEAGERLAPGLSDGFGRLRSAVDRAKLVTDDNILVVSTGPAFAAKWLAPRIYRFVDAHPDIEMRISANLGLVDFSRDAVDVGIRFGGGIYKGLISEALSDEWISPMASPDFIESNNIRTPEDLSGVTLLHDETLSILKDSPGWVEWLHMAGLDEIDAKKGLRFNHPDHAIDAAMRGAGVALARSVLAADDVLTGRLALLFPDQKLDTNYRYYLVYPEERAGERKIIAFKNWISTEMSGPEATL